MQKDFRLIMGRHCIEELARSSPDRIVEVYTCHPGREDALVTLLQRNKTPIRRLSKGELSQLVQSDSHQSFVAAVKERGRKGIKEFFVEHAEKEKSLVLLLDSIVDPHNIGAILRAAECFGVDAVIYSKNRGATLTPTVSKVSSGAIELVEMLKVSNLVETAKQLQREGYVLITAEGGESAQSIYAFSFPPKVALVMGSEQKGIQPLLRKNADAAVRIPMLGKIDSLNVSQATAIFLSSYQRTFEKTGNRQI